MKKLIALLLVCVMALALVACGGNAKGSVYYLNFKPEADQAWQEFAKAYTAKTGVEVKVVTAASGTYGDTLTAEMAKSDAPTLFQVSNPMALADWDEYALDLADAEFLKALSSSDFVMLNGENQSLSPYAPSKEFCTGDPPPRDLRCPPSTVFS